MKRTVSVTGTELVNADCLEVMAGMDEHSVDLIVTDPPYFKVKPEGWDHQWRGDEDYLCWLDKCLGEFARILKPEGSLYLFCGHRLSADIELMLRRRFNVLNHIIWAKPNGRWKGCCKESLRSYFPSTERILFAEPYPGPYQGRADCNNTRSSSLRAGVMAPLISYFRNARSQAGLSVSEIVRRTGKQTASHWFSLQQWYLPGEEDYLNLQRLFAESAGEYVFTSTKTTNAGILNRNYHELFTEYKARSEILKSLRRYFVVSIAVPYTDVWTYPPVAYYPGKHPCEKPADMLRDIILASSRPGELVADFFMGSGSTIKAALHCGRRALGVELESERFDVTVREVVAQYSHPPMHRD